MRATLSLLCLLLATLVQAADKERFIQATYPSINFLGRNIKKGNTRIFDWTGAQIRIVVSNTKFLDVSVTSAAGWSYIIDGKADGPFFMTANRTKVAKDLSLGSHTIVLWKRNEPGVPSSGASVFGGIWVSDKAKLEVYKASSRRLEFAGASMTGGYGVAGPSGCGGNGNKGIWQNSYRAYGGVISRLHNVDCQWVSQSGWGVAKGAGVFSTIYDLAAKSRTDKWDFNSWKADGVVVNLNTNDARANPPPTEKEFDTAYTNLVGKFRQVYGSKVQIYSICGPMITGKYCDLIQKLAQNDTHHHYLNIAGLPKNQLGCDGHPNQQGHEVIAGHLWDLISSTLKWN